MTVLSPEADEKTHDDPRVFSVVELQTLTERGMRIGALALELARGPQFGKRLCAADYAIRLCEGVDDAYDGESYVILFDEALATVANAERRVA